jgi:uncharacterized damage-inducible protein DinB
MTLGEQYLKELEMEAAASRNCVERIPAELFGWKPHEKSMEMGYLALLVAEIPKWISAMVETGDINFATWKHIQAKTGADLAAHFDENMIGARKALGAVQDETLALPFNLKAGEQVLMTSPRSESVVSTINHLVHHRGQLTVYMRLNNIAVPSIYGPSADEKSF